MKPAQLTADDLKLLGQYDTPTICNVIELFAVRPRNSGYMDSRIKSCFPEMPPIVGYAATATIRCDAPAAEGMVYSSMGRQLEAFSEIPGPPIVVFQDLDDPAVAATFGEIMCSSYQAFGAVGLITSGAARDLDQVRRLGFSCFSNDVICSHGYSHIVSVGMPVRVGGITVTSGDLLHADANGVTTIPHEIASEAAQVAAEFVAAEAIILDFLKTGSKDLKQYVAVRDQALNVIAELGKRVRK